MKTFTVKANVIRAAQIFQAKNDGRYYLNGVFIGQDGMVAGTNGHAAFVSSHDAEIDQDYILHISGPIPKSAKEIEFIVVGDRMIVDCKDRHSCTVKLLAASIIVDAPEYPKINERYPVYSDDDIEEFIGRNKLCIQAKYMANVSKVFMGDGGFDGVNVVFKDDISVMQITSSNDRLYPKNTRILIMPVRT